MNTAASLAVLRTAFIQAKLAEDAAKAARLEVESAILAHFPTDKLEGSVTDADFGITVAYKLTRTVDSEGVQNIWDNLSATAQKAFRVKFDLDLKQFRAIQDLAPKAFEELAPFVTSKPAKPAITIKEA